MEHDRWSWFAGGVVLGLLIGAGGVGGYAMMKYAEAHDAAHKAAERGAHWMAEADEQRDRAEEQRLRAEEQRLRAEEAEAALEALKSAP